MPETLDYSVWEWDELGVCPRFDVRALDDDGGIMLGGMRYIC